jgi:hypothetical protein
MTLDPDPEEVGMTAEPTYQVGDAVVEGVAFHPTPGHDIALFAGDVMCRSRRPGRIPGQPGKPAARVAGLFSHAPLSRLG